ncbi:DEAD/DEAH box helicase [Campylobacter fetus]|uniref:DEAD/DEAH box helicase family protein n=1 Tax=Campylobacter fetus TaxID=196 RepID=UPI00073A6FAF|nr:DEAD/DEAH box helicase [Campylobacter fetus]ALV64625.1 helicase domain-containing protein [Campylobacter fetus subsp. testudinum Sp3]
MSKTQNLSYENFLKSKKRIANFKSINIARNDLNKSLFEYQKDLITLALKKGHFAIFAMTGSGKTLMQGEWAYRVWEAENEPVLIVAPLAVAFQSISEIKEHLGYEVKFCEDDSDVINGINITNYEKLEKFDASKFVGIVLDESSRIKSYTSKARELLVENFKSTPYKLACSATPSPNDYTELGNHTAFLNIMSGYEMLSTYFIHDLGVSSSSSKWRLKGHGKAKFWEFVANWSAFFTKPSDLDYSLEEDAKFKLPNLSLEHIEIASTPNDTLFSVAAETLNERRRAKRDSLEDRCKKVAEICNSSNDNFLVWCELNDESSLLTSLINDAVEIKGSDSDEHKAKAMMDFANGKIKVLITKPKIAGFGMNWQKYCSNVIYASLSDSFESFFQSLRRVYRYGQKKDVKCYIVTSDAEANVILNLKRKESEFYTMIEGVLKETKNIVLDEIKAISVQKTSYEPKIEMTLPKFIKEDM